MRSIKILVIDDEEDMRELASMALAFDDRFAAVTADSGARGVTLAATECPDAVLLDWMMPGMDGADTLRALRADARTAAIPVIVLSGKAHDDDTGAFTALGAAGAIGKPFNPMTLAIEVSAILGRGVSE